MPILLGMIVLGWTIGCSDSETTVSDDDSQNSTSQDVTRTSVPAPSKTTETPQAEEASAVDSWKELVGQAEEHFQADDFEATEQALERLDELDVGSEELPEDQLARLEELRAGLQAKKRERADEDRKSRLMLAREAMNQGDYEAATQALNDVLSRLPTPEQRADAQSIADEIERRRLARRRLGAWMQMLASTDSSKIQTAQNQLAQEAETALPLILEAVQKADEPALVRNSLEWLRQRRRPDVAFPAMVGVLSRVEQQENWNDAIREIGRMNRPGAGKPLLELALSSEHTEQQVAALSALVQVADPPRNTFVALLPKIHHEEGALLAASLKTALHAMRIHGQDDLVARRGFDEELTAEQEQMLESLPERLSGLLEQQPPNEEPSPDDPIHAAKMLAATVGQLSPEQFSDVKIAAFSAETDESPAIAVLDNVWDSTEARSMWKHPVNTRSMIVLDLGEERTVTSVRVWNLNEENGAQRGWKDVDVFVSNSTSELNPVANGIVPPAPGAAETPDYSTVISVPYVRGRYVKLQARSLWNIDGHTGLSEIQVFGF